MLLLLLFFAQALHAANIIIVNQDGPGEGLNDPTPVAPVGGNPGTTIGQQRLNVFQRAAEFWSVRLVSSVPIRIAAKFDPLSCTANSGTLGSAGPIGLFRDFAGAPVANTYYASALANALAGTDLDPGADDIDATFNSDVGTSGCLSSLQWYYGFDHNAPASGVDFFDTVLHEFAHGLGFICGVNLSTGTKFNGFNDAFMRYLEDHRTGKLYPGMTDVERVSASTATGNLHWVGTNVLAMMNILSSGTSGGHVQMFAPNPQQPGSSVSHWDTALFPDELLEPYDTPTSDYRLTLQLMKDIGWKMVPPVPQIVTNGAVLLAGNCGFDNGAIDPDETVTISFSLRNVGSGDSGNIVATLLPGASVTAPSGPQNYGALPANGAAVSRPFTFTAKGQCGTRIAANLQLQDGTNNPGTVSFALIMGTSRSLTNAVSIAVPMAGAASPYPSTLTISNQTDLIHGLTVTLRGVNHANPDDLDILLIGPSGQSVILMSDAGGSADLANVTLKFDDAAASFLPDSSAITSGTYRPTDYQTGDTYPSPAPAGPYGTTLSVFDGTSANGTWRLFVRDDTSPRSGSIAGWSLSFPTCCADFTRPTNHPPVLASIANRSIHQGSTLIFTNAATDPDQPANALTFSLTNAPGGAAVDPSSGVFVWTPSVQQAPSTNTVGIVVTDNGVPFLSDTKSFTVVVALPPRIQSISLSGTNVNFQWTAIANQSYRVQYKTTLTQTNWVDLEGPVIAPGATAAKEDVIDPDQQRFYRILVLP